MFTAKINQCNENIAACYAQIEANEKQLLQIYREIYAEQQLEAQKQLQEEQRLQEQKKEERLYVEARVQRLQEVQRPVGTKLKWVLNPETYRVAVITKKGVLQVKSVTDGGGDCHDSDCRCTPCSEIYLGLPPWRKMRPLKKKFFESEEAWHASLPLYGELTVTPR